MKNKLLSAIIILIVEAIIVTSMLILPVTMPTEVRVLDICVLSIIWFMLSYDLFRPLIKFAFKNAPEYGSLGIRWIGQIFYIITSITFAVIALIFSISFVYQLLGQGLLFSFLLLAFFYATKAGNLVTQVATQQDNVIAARQQMRDIIRDIQDQIAIANYPAPFCASINDLEDKLRYLAPSDCAEAKKYEKQFTEVAQKVCIAMSNYVLNEDSINQDLLRLHRILENRKNVRE